MDNKDCRYVCVNCAYVYDPKAGDALSKIPPGTPFADLPESWVCPICYASKASFDPLD